MAIATNEAYIASLAAKGALAKSDLNPLTSEGWDAWSFIRIAGVPSPGVIPANGIKGFERETAWDKKKGKGQQGATLTLTTAPPAEGKIEFHLFQSSDIDFWQTVFLPLLTYAYGKKNENAINIYHPSLAMINISSVVVHKIAPLVHTGKGLYVTSVDFIEWIQPPKQSIVQTPPKAIPESPLVIPGNPYQAIINANDAQIQSLSDTAGLSPFVGPT